MNFIIRILHFKTQEVLVYDKLQNAIHDGFSFVDLYAKKKEALKGGSDVVAIKTLTKKDTVTINREIDLASQTNLKS
jgi:thiamine monophosphate synthase